MEVNSKLSLTVNLPVLAGTDATLRIAKVKQLENFVLSHLVLILVFIFVFVLRAFLVSLFLHFVPANGHLVWAPKFENYNNEKQVVS